MTNAIPRRPRASASVGDEHAGRPPCAVGARQTPAEFLRSGFELFWREPRSPARWLRVSLWSQHGCWGRPLKETSFAPGHLTEARGHSAPRTGPERSWRIVSCPPRYMLSSETVRSQPSPFQSCLTTPRCMVLGAPSGWTVRTHPLPRPLWPGPCPLPGPPDPGQALPGGALGAPETLPQDPPSGPPSQEEPWRGGLTESLSREGPPPWAGHFRSGSRVLCVSEVCLSVVCMESPSGPLGGPLGLGDCPCCLKSWERGLQL